MEKKSRVGKRAGGAWTPRRGAIFALLLIALPSLMLAAALSVDVGQMVLAKSRSQNAADFAALAGAYAAITDGPTQACHVASDYFAANRCGGRDTITPQVIQSLADGYVYQVGPARVTVRCPYASSRGQSLGYPASRTVFVEAVETIPTPFMAIARISSVDVRASAVAASKVSGIGCLFAKDNRSSVTGITFNGSRVECLGSAHSNSKIVINGSHSHFTDLVEYRYHITVNGSHNQFDMGYAEGPEQDYPITITRADLDPGTYDYEVPGNYVVNGANQTMPPGRWHIGGNLIINGSKFRVDNCILIVEGYVSFNGSLASFDNSTVYAEGTITFNGSNATIIRPAVRNIICMSNSTNSSAIVFNGSSQTCEGIVFAPRGGITYNGSNSGVHNGGVLGMTITVNGSGFTIDGTGGGSAVLAKLID